MNWTRVTGYGLIVWFVPFAVAFALFGIHDSNRPLFESLMTVTGVVTEVGVALLYFRGGSRPSAGDGLALGLLWMSISIVIDLPIFLAAFRMPLALYVEDIAVSYLAMPAITTGIAVAMRQDGRR